MLKILLLIILILVLLTLIYLLGSWLLAILLADALGNLILDLVPHANE